MNKQSVLPDLVRTMHNIILAISGSYDTIGYRLSSSYPCILNGVHECNTLIFGRWSSLI